MMLPPITFKPIFQKRIWGSDRLRALFHKELPDGESIGESWELADLDEGQSTIDGGPCTGMSARAFFENFGEAVGFTPEQCEFPFGLLIKFLDANDILSVQVHPDENACRLFPGAKLKTECWYILDAQPGASIYKGLIPNTSKADLQAAIEQKTVKTLLQEIPVQKGGFYHLPAGTIHALGAGIVVAEIQTPSDTTFRLYDWDRLDAQGNSRELHIQQALASIHYTNTPSSPPADNYFIGPSVNPDSPLTAIIKSFMHPENLVDCAFFSVARFTAYAAYEQIIQPDNPVILIVISGTGSITHTEKQTVSNTYSAGNTILLPANHAWKLTADDDSEFLITCLGPQKP